MAHEQTAQKSQSAAPETSEKNSSAPALLGTSKMRITLSIALVGAGIVATGLLADNSQSSSTLNVHTAAYLSSDNASSIVIVDY